MPINPSTWKVQEFKVIYYTFEASLGYMNLSY